MTEQRSKLSLADASGAVRSGDAKGAWNISPARAENLKQRARDMRRNQTEAQSALWERLKDKGVGGFSFGRQVVMGSAIVDFACRPRWLVVEVTAEGEAELAALSDRKLTEVGVRVLRFSEEDVLTRIEDVEETILAELQKPFERKEPASGRSYRMREFEG